MLHFTTQVAFKVGIPIRLLGDYVKNVHHAKTDGQDKGYQVGTILGSAKNKGGLEFAYFNKYSEAHSTLSDFADSDFGNGGTNRKGHTRLLWRHRHSLPQRRPPIGISTDCNAI